MSASDDEPRHWRRTIDSEGICWLVLDKAGASANTLSQDVLLELEREIARLREQPPRGLVIKSAKRSGFVLGADVKEFGSIGSAAEGAALATRGQALLDELERLPSPTVAAIDGFALGGGLELALACAYRVAVKSYERMLGLPEVQLGIHPGFGGTVRAVQLLGAPLALDLMLTGRLMSPIEANAAGLVDRLVPSPDGLDAAARDLINARPTRHRAKWHLKLLNLAPLRRAVAKRVRARVASRARREHYPAPFAIVDLWQRYGASGARAYRAEAESIGTLLVTPTCRNLVRMFGLRERMRNLAPKADAVRRVHVVGAGVMGGDIAAWCALRGLDVTLQDRAREFVEPALRRAKGLFAKRLKEPGAAEAAANRLKVDLDADEIGSAEVVIEAIVEKLEAKQSLFRELEPRLDDRAIVATNTSSIKLENMANALRKPGRFVGLHFFNPVASLPLVEVIRGADTDEETMRRALAFVTQIGKLPLPCRSEPGFVVNRVLMPYMIEALRAHEDGHPLETIDAAAVAFGMPVGPVELADRVGLDVALYVAEVLGAAFGTSPPAVLGAKVSAGELGAKKGRGFYAYVDDKAQKQRQFPAPDEDLQDRLLLPLVNEAVACWADGVVTDPDLLDAGVVFGTGFAPFRGGPLHYARQRGIGMVVGRLEALAARFGSRFAPHPGWQKLGDEPVTA